MIGTAYINHSRYLFCNSCLVCNLNVLGVTTGVYARAGGSYCRVTEVQNIFQTSFYELFNSKLTFVFQLLGTSY